MNKKQLEKAAIEVIKHCDWCNGMCYVGEEGTADDGYQLYSEKDRLDVFNAINAKYPDEYVYDSQRKFIKIKK